MNQNFLLQLLRAHVVGKSPIFKVGTFSFPIDLQKKVSKDYMLLIEKVLTTGESTDCRIDTFFEEVLNDVNVSDEIRDTLSKSGNEALIALVQF